MRSQGNWEGGGGPSARGFYSSHWGAPPTSCLPYPFSAHQPPNCLPVSFRLRAPHLLLAPALPACTRPAALEDEHILGAALNQRHE